MNPTLFSGPREEWPNLLLDPTRSLTLDGAIVEPAGRDMGWADMPLADRVTWRTVAIGAGLDTSLWET